MTISAFDIYLLGVFDDIGCVLFFLTVVSFSILLFVLKVTADEWERTNQEDRKFNVKIIKILSISTILLLIINLFTPNAKTLAAMWVVPSVVNNEKIQAIGSNGLDILLEYTDDWVKELKGESKKEESND